MSSAEVFRALRNENWFHHHATEDSEKKYLAKKRLKNAFYPQEDEWKRKIWLHGKEAFVLAFAAFFLSEELHQIGDNQED